LIRESPAGIEVRTTAAGARSGAQKVLQLPLKCYESRGGNIFYEFRHNQVKALLTEHSYENDGDVRFEDYRYEISITAIKQLASETDQRQWRNDFAHRVFELLKGTQDYSLMLVDDLQLKIEEFHPQARAFADR
jgi:hypothetical protein